jgi:hypothetical protein
VGTERETDRIRRLSAGSKPARHAEKVEHFSENRSRAGDLLDLTYRAAAT